MKLTLIILEFMRMCNSTIQLHQWIGIPDLAQSDLDLGHLEASWTP